MNELKEMQKRTPKYFCYTTVWCKMMKLIKFSRIVVEINKPTKQLPDGLPDALDSLGNAQERRIKSISSVDQNNSQCESSVLQTNDNFKDEQHVCNEMHLCTDKM